MHLLKQVYNWTGPLKKSGTALPRARLRKPDQVAQNFFWDSSDELQRWDVTASLYQGLAIFLEKCILLMFRSNFPWNNGHRLSLTIFVWTTHEGLHCLVYNLFSSGTQQLHPLPALSCLLVPIFFMLASLSSVLPWFRCMETDRLCWRKRRQKN